jgi:hypothetical protein
LCFQHAQVAQNLSLEFIHHPHLPDPILASYLYEYSGYDPTGKLMNNAVENSE